MFNDFFFRFWISKMKYLLGEKWFTDELNEMCPVLSTSDKTFQWPHFFPQLHM